ncbi:MAG TPA: dihydroneopterin aldolase [Candidatus Baltobacteraceae bacterium]|nr:dihydroneopterin aldolase [Candidatus Baltobacteraceae bacterium]
MDRIALHDIVVEGRHGVHADERERPQPFRLDLVLELDLSRAAASDDLRDTINYAAIHRRIVEIVQTHSYALLERLAGVILDEITGDDRVVLADLSIAKPGLLDGATPSVRLVRAREPWP